MRASAIVLAGGRSTRMGNDKAMLNIDGETLLERTVEVLRRLSDDVLVVGRLVEINISARFVTDEVPGRGPLGGLLTGLRHARHRYVICVSCDLPFLSSDVLSFLLAHAPGREAVVALVGQRLQPLHAVYARDIGPVVAGQLESGDRSMHHLLQNLKVRTVPEADLVPLDPDLHSFLNVNTPADWSSALRVLSGPFHPSPSLPGPPRTH